MSHHGTKPGQGWKHQAERLAERLGDHERIVELAQAELARSRERERQWTERLQLAEGAAQRAQVATEQAVALRVGLAEQELVTRRLQLDLEATRRELAHEHEVAEVARRLLGALNDLITVTAADHHAAEVEDSTTHADGAAVAGRTTP